MTTRERIEVIAGEHGWRPTSESSVDVLQIERGDTFITIRFQANDNGLGVMLRTVDKATKAIGGGLPGVLAWIRQPA